MTAFAMFTILLAAGMTARLTRLIVADDLGLWWVRGPASRWAWEHDRHLGAGRVGWRSLAISGLSCPFCVGFWLGCLVLTSLALVGGPAAEGTPATIWRWVAGAFTLNYVVAHVGARLGDTDD